jgi:hypothetical protein
MLPFLPSLNVPLFPLPLLIKSLLKSATLLLRLTILLFL